MRWVVETLNPTVDAEIGALPADMRARFVRFTNLIEEIGRSGAWSSFAPSSRKRRRRRRANSLWQGNGQKRSGEDMT
jgi:hypothetical protein